MSATNRGAVREVGDYYRTPRWCVQALLSVEPVSGNVLDPGCGDGSISVALKDEALYGPGDRIVGVESDEGLAATAAAGGIEVFTGDFLDYALKVSQHEPFHCVVGNPPYRDAADFARAALRCVKRGGSVCFLLRLNFLGSSRKRMDLVGKDSELARVHVLSRRPSFTGNGRTDACDYAWFVWVKGWPGAPSVLNVLGDDAVRRD